MKLSIEDRLIMKELYPQQANNVNAILVKEIDDKVRLSEKEQKEAKLSTNGKVTRWENDIAKVEVKFTKLQMAFLRDRFSSPLISLCYKLLDKKPDVKKANESDT